MAEIYPASYPCPTWDYGQAISTYPNRTPMECGWTRQRARWPTTGTSVDLTFKMSTAEFDLWSAWINDFGYEWFTIDLERFGGVKKPTDMRLMAPYQYSYGAYDVVYITTTGEFFDGDA